MSDQSSTPPPYDPKRHLGTSFAGETTRGEGSTIFPGAHQPALQVIGDFEVIGRLGQGGMGTVYRVRQISLDRQVALKILPSHCESDAGYVARFEREARVAANLSHANLVKVYSSGVADGSHYIAMELVEGETLGQWLKHGALMPLEALRITLDVARALECGWRTANLVHRDIKPGNIFLSEEGHVKLGDLGLAKIAGSDTTGLTHTGAAMGTPHYISPEQARGDKDIDFRADIYSLGCTLYQMLTGQTPYSGTDGMAVMSLHRDAPPPAILKVMPQCPLPIARLVSKMLKKQRRERPASYEELIATIEGVRAQLDPALAAPLISPTLQATKLPPTEAGTVPRAISDSGTSGGSPSSAKSKLPIYGGIAAGVAVLGIVAWLAWPKEEKLTAAQRWARDHAGEKKLKAESAAPPVGAAPAKEATKADEAPTQGDDRAAAKWVLDANGNAEIVANGRKLSLRTAADLPPEPFALTRLTVDLDKAPPLHAFENLHVLAGLSELSSIQLKGAKVRDDFLVPLRGLPKLTELKLYDADVTDNVVEHVVKMPALKYFEFNGCSGFTGSRLGELAGGPVNKMVFIRTSLTSSGLKALAQCHQLKTLDIYGRSITDANIGILAALDQLTELHLGETAVTGAGLESLKSLHNLELLDWTIPEGDAGPQIAKAAAVFPTVRNFLTRIRKHQPSEFATLSAFPSLNTVQFFGPEVNDELIRQLNSLPNLTGLVLGEGPTFTDTGLASLAEHPAIREIALNEANSITDAGLLKLSTITQLKRLNLGRCKQLTPAGLEAFQKARPDVTLFR